MGLASGRGGFRSNYGIARSLLTYYGPVWRRGRMSRFYRQFIANNDLCFDLGAHVGNRVRAWRRLGARVVAVEPHPKCLDVLRWLYGRDASVQIVPGAVGAAPGRTVLLTSSATPTLSSTAADWVEEIKERDRRFGSIRWDTSVEVAVTTLDEMIALYGEPTFCKIDVEGSELQVLRGLSRALPALSFEFLPASIERAYACIDRLAELAPYSFRWSEVETMQWSCPRWIDGDGIKEILAAQPAEGRSGDVYARRAE